MNIYMPSPIKIDPCYLEITRSLVAALLLSEYVEPIVSKHGHCDFTDEDGTRWVKSARDWIVAGFYITEKEFDRAFALLKRKKFVRTELQPGSDDPFVTINQAEIWEAMQALHTEG